MEVRMNSWMIMPLLAGAVFAAPPLPVTDLQIQLVDSAHVRLFWSPVIHDTSSQSLLAPLYQMYTSQLPWLDQLPSTLHVTTPETELVFSRPDNMSFFQIVVVDEQLDLVRIPAGQFAMGQASVATPEHGVTLTSDFLLGRTEVTNAQFLEALNWAQTQGLVSVVGDYVQQYGVNLLRINQSNHDFYEIRFNEDIQEFYLQVGTYDGFNWGPGVAYPGGSYNPSDHPVINVSWYGAACYCDWRSQMENLPCYYEGQWSQIPNPRIPFLATGYRLPTEAEWEYAAQYDDERIYPWGPEPPTCSIANYSILPSNRCVGWTSPVGMHAEGASMLGLQDMAGNTWEWCNDWYTSYSVGEVYDPSGPDGGYERIVRGGGWENLSSVLPCAFRLFGPPAAMMQTLGFRLCRTP